LYVQFLLHHELLPPKARPPPESFEGVQSTKLFDRILPNSNCHFDGNKSWSKLARTKYAAKRFRTPQVVHGNSQFTKPIPSRKLTIQGGRAVRLAELSGTQCIDRVWTGLDRAVPSTLCKKTPIMGTTHRMVDPMLYRRVWSWLYRYNKRHVQVTAREALLDLVKLLKARA